MFFCVIACLAWQNLNLNRAPGDKFTNQVISRVSKKLSKKYGLEISAIGGGEDKEGIWRITVHYHYYGAPLDLAKSRAIMVNIIELYLNEINNDEKIRPYLKNYPFLITNLNLALITNQIDGQWCFDPYMDTIGTMGDTIDYNTRDAENRLKYKNTIVEKYEDALRIVKENGQLESFN